MASQQKHAGDEDLSFLLTGDEDSDEYRQAAAHVESCEICRRRLDEMAGPTRLDEEARDLLQDYPWEDVSNSRVAESFCTDRPERTHVLDFLAPPSHPEMLGRLGRYEVERFLGAGGMGVVLKAFDTELNRPVAIKVLAEHLAHSGAARQRFAREAKAAAAIVHEHVVAIHNVEADRDVPFLVMQYVSGESLQMRVDREGPLDVKELLRIGIQAASGLAAAHEQGVIHRDVKPANILLENGVERVLLTDFGLARTVDDASLTHTGIVTGTPHYMSPEQANGESTDHRTDLFSLGCVLYFMASGHPPFRAERAMGVLNRICHDRHRPIWQVNSDVPFELSDMIDRLLEKKPARRIASARDVKDALARVLVRMQQPRAGRPHRLKRFLRRHPVGVALVCGIAVLAALLTAAFRPNLRENRPDSSQVEIPAAQVARVPTTQSTEKDPQTVAVELSIEAAMFQQIADRIDRLERELDQSQFSWPGDHEFDRAVQAMDQTLDRLNDEVPSELEP